MAIKYIITIAVSHKYNKPTYQGRVHLYETWDNNQKHETTYKRYIFSQLTGIERLTIKDAQDDACILAKEIAEQNQSI